MKFNYADHYAFAQRVKPEIQPLSEVLLRIIYRRSRAQEETEIQERLALAGIEIVECERESGLHLRDITAGVSLFFMTGPGKHPLGYTALFRFFLNGNPVYAYVKTQANAFTSFGREAPAFPYMDVLMGAKPMALPVRLW